MSNMEPSCDTSKKGLVFNIQRFSVNEKLIIQNVLHAENVLMSAIIGLLRCPVSG